MLRGASPGSYAFVCGRRRGAHPGTLTNSPKGVERINLGRSVQAQVELGTRWPQARKAAYGAAARVPHGDQGRPESPGSAKALGPGRESAG